LASLSENSSTDYLLTIFDEVIDGIPNQTSLYPVLYNPLKHDQDPPTSLAAYDLIDHLGKGGFSKVYLVRQKSTAKIFALKVISKKFSAKWGGQLVKREFELMKSIAHPLIVSLYSSFPTETTYNLVLEYCPGGSLFSFLRDRKKLSLKTSLIYFAELLCVINYLHKNGVLFRDLKAENVLLDAQGHIKLTDFGLARKFDMTRGRDMYSFCGSPIYIAPETLRKESYDHRVDYYALGILLYEMLVGKPPFLFKKAEAIKKAKLMEDVQFPESMDQRVKTMLENCLDRDPDVREGSYDFYAEWVTQFDIDMEMIEYDHHFYKIEEFSLDFLRPRGKFEGQDQFSYHIEDANLAQKMTILDEIIKYERPDILDIDPDIEVILDGMKMRNPPPAESFAEVKDLRTLLNKNNKETPISSSKKEKRIEEEEMVVPLQNTSKMDAQRGKGQIKQISSESDDEIPLGVIDMEPADEKLYLLPQSEYGGQFMEDFTNLGPITMLPIARVDNLPSADLEAREILKNRIKEIFDDDDYINGN